MLLQSHRQPANFEPTALQRTIGPCSMMGNLSKVPPIVALDDLRRKIQLDEGEINATKEEMNNELVQNEALIEKLRDEINAKRQILVVPGVNEALLAKALRNHHPGGSAFRTKEPRDVNDSVDFQTSDLVSKRDRLRDRKRVRLNYMKQKLKVFNDAVEDVVYLELEGPLGDSRCLNLENHIADVGKKLQEAGRLRDTYMLIRNQLIMESRENDLLIKTAQKMVTKQAEDLLGVIKSLEKAFERMQAAIAISMITETEFRQKRSNRQKSITSLKKECDDLKRNLLQLAKNAQLLFSSHEAMHMDRMGRVTSTTTNLLDDSSEQARWTLKDMERDAQILSQCTGTHGIDEAQSRFEGLRDTLLRLQSLAKEREVEKLQCLQRLEELQVVRSSITFDDEKSVDVELRQMEQQHRDVAETAAQQRQGVDAANSRVTQSLVRLRQLLEYVADALVKAKLLTRPPQRLLALETVEYLPALLELVLSGAARLMVAVGEEEPEQASRRAELARVLMTRSEVRMSMHVQPAILKSYELGQQSTDEGETTGDEVKVAARSVMKLKAAQLVQAKLKAGHGKKARW